MTDKYRYSNELSLASQMKSWMAINPSFGCVWDCAYCIQHKDEFFDSSDYKRIHKVKKDGVEYTPEDVVTEIMTNPRITSKSPLTFYNFSDPFFPQNTSDLVKILEGLDERDFTNVIGLITRTNAPNKVLDSIAKLQNLRPIVFVSYAGYNNRLIETAPNNKRLDLMKRLHERGIPTMQYLRPVVKEWIEDGQFEKTRDEVNGIVDGVVMSGVRLTPEIVTKITRRGLVIPKVSNFTNKFFPVDLQKQITDAYDGVAPVYRYTSCAASATFGVSDYNAHLDFLRIVGDEHVECPLPCRVEQKERCAEFNTETYAPSREKVELLQKKIGYEDRTFKITKEGRVIFDDPLSKEDRTFFRHNLSRHVDYNENEHHFDQVHLEEKR